MMISRLLTGATITGDLKFDSRHILAAKAGSYFKNWIFFQNLEKPIVLLA
jgi:hypothetical protein